MHIMHQVRNAAVLLAIRGIKCVPMLRKGGETMLYTFTDQILIILLTLVGVFHTEHIALLCMLAGILLVWVTAASFYEKEAVLDEEAGELTETGGRAKGPWLLLLQGGLFFGYSFASGYAVCFAIFMVLRGMKGTYRGFIAILSYLAYRLIIGRESIQAMDLVRILWLILAMLMIKGVQVAIEYVTHENIMDQQRLRTANINELHTRQMNDQLIKNSYLADKNARLLERENISRNIHNSVGHSITAAIMTLDAADMLYEVKPEEARKKMQDANERIRGSLDSIRRAVRVLDENSRMISFSDLKCELQTIADDFMLDTTRTVQIDFTGMRDDGMLPHEHAEFLTGAFEEMLSNGVRHGQADHFVLLLTGDNAHVRMEVSDNGHGDYSQENQKQRLEQGFGLKKILAYAARSGGKAEFINQGGFHSLIELPIFEQEQTD